MSIFKKENDLESLSDRLNVQQSEIIKYFKALGIDYDPTMEITDKMSLCLEKYLDKKRSLLENVDTENFQNNDSLKKDILEKAEQYYTDGKYQDAFDYFYLAYNLGNMYAAYKLGRVCENDLGFGKNYAVASDYYRIASDANIGEAQYRLAEYYRDGIGCEKDFLQAVQLFKLALKQGFNTPSDYENLDNCVQNMYLQQAEKGDLKGYFRLARYLVKKKGIGFDSPEVKKYVILAAEHGDSSALYRMGLYAEDEGNENQAKEYFIQAAKNGNGPSILRLKDNYGENVLDIIKDNAEGLVSMGEYYFKKGDIAQSLDFYMKAAELNNAEAQYRIGSVLVKYPDYETDLERNHIYWLKLAADQGNADANYKLGVCYEGDNDTIVEKDRALAFEYFSKAAHDNQALAQSKLGFYYKSGVIVEQDHKKSFEWYLKGAQNGHSIAQNQLAFCYLKGEGVEQDNEKAFYWYEKAAEQNHRISLYQLGLCYMYGKGTEKDYQKAKECFEKALDNGYDGAQKQLDVLKKIETLNGQSDVERLRNNFATELSKINVSADLARMNAQKERDTNSRTVSSEYIIENRGMQSDIKPVSLNEKKIRINDIDTDSLSEKQAIELMFKLQDKINADVLNEVAAQQRLDELNKEEKLQEAKDLLAQTGFTQEQLELLKNYFNKSE